MKTKTQHRSRKVVQLFAGLNRCKEGVDYGETFAPVVKYTSIRALCAEVRKQDYELHQMDARTAFLNGDIDKDIFIEIPEGVKIVETDLAELNVDMADKKDLDLVFKLEKSMYGTKQAPRCWNRKIHSVLSGDLGFERSDGDPCLYVREDNEGTMIIALYVDDFLLAAKSTVKVSWMKSMLSNRFDMKYLGETKVCLGLEITRNRKEKKLWLSQRSYMETLLERFDMSNCKRVPTPMKEPKLPEQRLELISDLKRFAEREN